MQAKHDMAIKQILIPFFICTSFLGFAQTGIGTTSPVTKLHVKSNGPTFRIEGTDHVYMELYPQGATTRYAYLGYPGASSTQLTLMSQFSTGTIAFGTNNTSRMFLAADGKLSVGTSTALSTLTVGSADGVTAGEITLNPSTTLYEGGQLTMKKSLTGSTVDWYIDQYGTTAADARFRIFNATGELNGLAIKESGYVGLGTNAPTVRLQVAGDIIANSIAGSSDERFKMNIATIANPLQKVMSLRGVNFDWRTQEFPTRQFSTKRTLGFIAQEVEKVLPEIVQTENTAEAYKSVQYDKVVALLVEAVKEQQKQINRLNKKIKYLSRKVAK
ncbi:MAG: tail fiber domain-containing protein [Aquirufa sp.]